jgi:hypothetical protein
LRNARGICDLRSFGFDWAYTLHFHGGSLGLFFLRGNLIGLHGVLDELLDTFEAQVSRTKFLQAIRNVRDALGSTVDKLRS